MEYPKGLDPYVPRQNLLHHMYSPLVSVDSSPSADILVQSVLNTEDTILSILKPYGNNVKYPIANQQFKITNTQLITKNYPSFPIRFDFPLPDLLSIKNASNMTSLQQLFSISSLEGLLKKLPLDSNDIYLEFFNKVISSNSIVPFDTFNHPISQIFVIDYHQDSIDYLRAKIVEFRNFNFPKYFQINDLLMHVFVVFDDTKAEVSDLSKFELQLRDTLSIAATFIQISSCDKSIKVYKNENSTIEQDLQRITFNTTDEYFSVPETIDTSFRNSINQFINLHLIPHMEKKIRIWDDQVLAPKRSIANRFFSVSRKLFNNNNNPGNPQNITTFNYQENYYHKSSPEQSIRKLADWALILKDFKYSYSIYDFIKKDFNNDKAWVYVASTQEMCIISLLLVQTQLANNHTEPPDRNTLRKIRHDIIEPYLDNLSYTYKSRVNLKTYSLRTQLVVVELLLCMCVTFNMYWWWVDLIEKYLFKCVQEFDTHLLASNHNLQVIKAIIYERLGYVFGKASVENLSDDTVQEPQEVEEGFYSNPFKLQPRRTPNFAFNRCRKSSLWYLLSIKQWLALKRNDHVKDLLQNIRYTFDLELTDNWYDRTDGLLGFVKRLLIELENIESV